MVAYISFQGFTYPVRSRFLEDILEITGHRLTPYNQIDDYGQEKSWKMQKQALRKRKSQIASVVEVCSSCIFMPTISCSELWSPL